MLGITNATIIVGGGTEVVLSSVLYNEYTSSGTWTKPANLKYAFVITLGGGGGGGGGRRGATLTNRGGGGGGAGGCIVSSFLKADDLPETISYVIGAGGNGAGTVLSDNSNGGNGSVGGDTLFGTYSVAKGGGGGTRGTTNAGNGGVPGSLALCVPSDKAYAGITGGASSLTTQSPAVSLIAGSFSGGAGSGGGASISSANIQQLGGNGGGVLDMNLSIIAGGVGNGSNGIAGTSNVYSKMNIRLGSGSGGSVGPGRDGALYGSGGSGGGATLNGNTVGQGGKGAQGIIFIIEIY